jgi:opacity protein-like surface antigen
MRYERLHAEESTMKLNRHLSGIAGAMLASVLALPAAAAEKESGVYLNVDIGPSWAEDVRIDVAGISGDAELDVGVRMGLALGYNFNRYLGLEFDTGFLYNEFDQTDSSLSHVPFMANGVFRYPTDIGLEPYVGAGIGGAVNVLYINDFGIDDSDADFNFAWQAMAGLRYRFANHMAIGVGYKYFGTLDSNYGIEGVNVDVGTSNNHMLDLSFNVQF